MTRLQDPPTKPGALSAPRRNHYYFGKLMDVLHFEQEQSYGIGARRLLNRLSLGDGVLCGLLVDKDAAGHLCVSTGVAIDTQGREIIVPKKTCIDPWVLTDECGQTVETLSRNERHLVHLCVAYRECAADFAPVLVTDCAIKEECAPGTTIESFRLLVQDTPPPVVDGNAAICDALLGSGLAYEIVATVETGGKPFALAISGDGRRALLLNETGPALCAIDVDTGALTPLALAGFSLQLPLGGGSVAPEGGPAFATHAAGIATVDLQSDPPKITGSVASQKPYGACAAAAGGKVLYAIDTGSGKIDCIDMIASTFGLVVIATLDTGGGAVDLAVSPDGKWLYVADLKGLVVARIECATNTIVAGAAQPIDPTSRSVAARHGSPNAEVYVARDGAVRRVTESGVVADFAIVADGRDTDFTTMGDLLYLVSGKTNELAIFRADTMSELTRVKVGEGPVSVAVVPHRRRAVVANATAGTVSIIDVVPRKRLCEALSGPCGCGDARPCVTLATIELLADGTIGAIDACSYRRTVYSNAVLFDMILCLADRIEECCAVQSPPPPPPPEPPPLPVTTFQVTAVDFRSRQNQVQAELDPNHVEVPTEIPTREGGVSVIRITFNRNVDVATVTAAQTAADLPNANFQVRGKGKIVPIGIIQADPAPNAVRFIIRDTETPQFRPGPYTVALFGDPPSQGRLAIADVTGALLDGDTNPTLPSGNNVAGGIFKFSFIIND